MHVLSLLNSTIKRLIALNGIAHASPVERLNIAVSRFNCADVVSADAKPGHVAWLNLVSRRSLTWHNTKKYCHIFSRLGTATAALYNYE